jgi:hypothetical protein
MQTMKIFCILTITAVSASAAVNIIDNTYGVGAGSFELGAYSTNSGNSFNYMRLSSTSSTIAGWTVGGIDGVDWITFPNNAAQSGLFSVDLAGPSFVNRQSVGSISTVIPTLIGFQYLISFYAYGGDGDYIGNVMAGSLNQNFLAPMNTNATVADYDFFEYSFTALDTSTMITFSSIDSWGYGPVIDNVVVVPEPSAAMLGLVGVSLLFKRSRTKNQRSEQ